MNYSVKEINKKIDTFKQSGNEPKELIVGYKTYAHLMSEDKFADKISKDQIDPMIRYYKGLKVKIVTEKKYFEVK
ncbi:hypothetical protein [Acinetobacter sp.]|uniref:hypothetical protein n=1 Tax=Acinetobacter sp. TaxID=472 RepID=UPI0035B4647D